MAYGSAYRGQWEMADDGYIAEVYIYDTQHIIPDGDPVTYYDMVMGGNPLIIKTINNGRQKWGIFSKQARITFLSSNFINAYTFVDSTDMRWYVECYADSTILFKGYLVLSECARPFLPNPQEVTLVASDNLGLLKESKLTTPDGENPTGKHRIADYIAWCLKKTNLDLPFQVINNVKPGKGSQPFSLFFSASGDYFVTEGLKTDYFNGLTSVIISGTASNNTTYTIESVDNSGLVTQVNVVENITTAESAPNAIVTDNATGHLYDKCYLDAKTFEAEIGESEDCYTVLEKILDKDCALFQWEGIWVIQRYNEINQHLAYGAQFDNDGVYITIGAGSDLTREIGATGIAKWCDASQITTYELRHKFARHTFRYDYPKEIPCNKDFLRGDFIDGLPNEIINGVTYTVKKYELDCWTLVKDLYPPNQNTPATQNEAYIRRFFDPFNVEKFKDVTITWAPSEASRLEHEPIEVSENDKFDFRYLFKWSSDFGGAGSTNFVQCHVRLEGNDGSFWQYEDNDNSWHNVGNTWSRSISKNWVPNDVDETEWQTFEFSSREVPVSGFIVIAIYWGHIGAIASRNLHIAGFEFDYIPYINGSFQNFTGQSSKAERIEEGYSANIDEDVSISDSPKPLLKGGLFTKHGTKYVLQPQYWDSQQWALDPPNHNDYFQRFEYHRVNANYNQVHYTTRFFEGNLKGLANIPDLIHKYILAEIDPDSNDRKFMLIEMEQNWKTGIWRGKFAETWNTSDRVFPPFEFKYITE